MRLASVGGRLRIRQRGTVTQAACKQARRRVAVAEDARYPRCCRRGTNRTWTGAAAGKQGSREARRKLGKCEGVCGRLIARASSHPMPSSHRIASHHISSLTRRNKSPSPSPSHHYHQLVPTYTLPPYWAMPRRLLCPALPLRA